MAADAALWSMRPGEQGAAMVELERISRRLEELRLRVCAAGDRAEVSAGSGASSTAAWLAHETKLTRAAAHADLRLARALDEQGFAATRAALATGQACRSQVEVIVWAVGLLDGEDVTAEQRRQAEAWLIGEAAHHDARALRILGRRIFEVIAPEAADAKEADALEKEEARARRKASFAMRDNGDGTHSGNFKLPDLHAAILKKALEAFVAPRRIGERRTDPDTGRKMPYSQLLGHGFLELIEHLPVDRLPQSGGVAATIVVTTTLDTLRGKLDTAGVLDTGERISPGEARRLACRAGIIPAVLGGDSVVLDMGRRRRAHDTYQRLAMGLRDKGCRAESCDRPPAWCHAHHLTPWSHGGRTTVADGALLCPFHHTLAHHDDYDMRKLASGALRFHRRE